MLDIPNYKLLSKCGRGAYGDVWIAVDSIGRRVALKIVEKSSQIASEVNGLHNFARINETQHLIRIYHIGETDNLFYYTMELADDLNGGQDDKNYVPATLSNILNTNHRFNPTEARKICRDLLEGLRQVHNNNLAHRDVKPENILFVNKRPKLSDMGLLRNVSQSVSIGGTLGFIPPERLKCGEGSHSTADDLYAMGKVLYCMLSGNPPEKYPSIPHELIDELSGRELNKIITIACNKDPECRFKSAEEFACAMDNGLSRKQRLAYWWYRAGHIICGFLFWLALVAGVSFLPSMLKNSPAVSAGKLPDAAKNFAAKIKDCGEPLRIQLKKAAGHKGCDEFYAAVDSLSALPDEKAQKKLALLHSRLALFANAMLPPTAGIPKDHTAAMRRSGYMHGMLNSPLVDFLPAGTIEKYRKAVKEFDEKYVIKWKSGSVMPGEYTSFDHMKMLEVNFVPPGEFISPVDGKLRKVDYPFWAATKEAITEDFANCCGFIPPNSQSFKPALHLTWNDFLAYCKHHTEKLQSQNRLPPGYIVRPMTEDEWIWAMLGAWRQHTPAAPDAPNSLGIRSIMPLYEMVISRDAAAPNAIRILRRTISGDGIKWKRGLSFFYQNLYSGLGFRCAIAPGNESFFEKNLKTGEPQHLVFKNRRFELIGGNMNTYRHDETSSFCRFLGGRLGILDDKELHRILPGKFFCLRSWHSMVDAAYKDGAWRWSNGKKVDGIVPPAYDRFSVFGFTNGKFTLTPGRVFPVFFCEWSEAEWQNRLKRKDRWNHKEVVKLFDIGKRRFALIRFKVLPHIMRRIIQLIGAKPVDASETDILQKLKDDLAEYITADIMLGGYYSFGKWKNESGKTIFTTRFPLAGRTLGPMPYLNTIGLSNGKLCEIQNAQFFMVEIPAELNPEKQK